MHSVTVSSLALAVALAACGGGGGGGTQPPPPPPAVFTSLTVTPANPAMVVKDTLQLIATPRDQNGAAISGLPAATFSTPGPSVTVSAAGSVIAQQPGPSTITASLTSGTTTHTATANATVAALSTTADVTASGTGQSFTPDSVKIAVNGTVTWTFPGPTIHNVTFATPPAGGNIGNMNTGSETRTFGTAGRFSYQCTLHAGMSGAVIVRTP